MLHAHNSYHTAPDPALLSLAASIIPPSIPANSPVRLAFTGSEYTNPSLTDLLSIYRVRSLELDIYEDKLGGAFAYNVGPLLINKPFKSADPVMMDPGFKVLHLDQVDYGSTCLTFRLCLAEIKAWSVANPLHDPITIHVELKTSGTLALLLESGLNTTIGGTLNNLMATAAAKDPAAPSSIAPIAPISTSTILAEAEDLTDIFGLDNIVTPDSVRGTAATLGEALLAPKSGWPTLSELRGKFIIVQTGGTRLNVLEAYPNLVGSPIFTAFDINSASASAAVPSDVVFLTNGDTGFLTGIAPLIEKGYIVRGFADRDLVEVRNNDTTKLESLLVGGCHQVGSDGIVPNKLIATTYLAQLPGNATLRCNPVTALPGCVDVDQISSPAPGGGAPTPSGVTPSSPGTGPGAAPPRTSAAMRISHTWAAAILTATWTALSIAVAV